MLIEVFQPHWLGRVYALPLPLIVLAIPVLLLLLWRLFRFTLLPILHPDEPKELPYWIPIFGHTWTLFKYPMRLVESGINLTNRTREPFTIQIIGRTFYMITAPEDAFAAYKASTVLSFDSFLDDSLRAFGVDESSLKLAWHKPIPGDACYRDPNPVNPKQKPFIHWIRDIYRQALLPGEKMNHMVAHFHSYTDRNLQWERVSSFGLSPGETKGPIRLSMKDFTTTIMLEAITDSMFGNQLVKVEPNIIKHAAELSDEVWMLVYRLPKYFAGRVLDKRMKIMNALEKYRQIPQEERTAGGEAWSVEMVLKAQDILGMSSESNNAFVTLIHWAANGNTSMLCFWLLSYLLWDPSLLARIRREIAPAFQTGTLDLAYLMSSCPLLESIFFESLRVSTGAVSARRVTSPITIGGKVLKPGREVLIKHRALHLNEQVWGDSAGCFDPERFVKNGALSSHSSYRPFGGGSTYCPGRVIARQEVCIFVALALERMEMVLVPGQAFPLLDDTRPSIGVTAPMPGMDLYVDVSERRRSVVGGEK